MEEQINKPLHIILVSIAMVIPSIARAQTATAFDGTYAGVSNTANGGGSSCNPFNPTPRPLTVLDGHAQFTGGSFASGDVVFEGNLSPQGDIAVGRGRLPALSGPQTRPVGIRAVAF